MKVEEFGAFVDSVRAMVGHEPASTNYATVVVADRIHGEERGITGCTVTAAIEAVAVDIETMTDWKRDGALRVEVQQDRSDGRFVQITQNMAAPSGDSIGLIGWTFDLSEVTL